MKFKELTVYQLKKMSINFEDLLEKLNHFRFNEPGENDLDALGFINPIDEAYEELAVREQHVIALTLCHAKKNIPAAQINAAVDKRIAVIEEKELRTVTRKEKDALKDDVIMGMVKLYSAVRKTTEIIIDTQLNRIYINAKSASKCETALAFLRKALGSLPVVSLNTVRWPSQTLTTCICAEEPIHPQIVIDTEGRIKAIHESVDTKSSVVMQGFALQDDERNVLKELSITEVQMLFTPCKDNESTAPWSFTFFSTSMDFALGKIDCPIFEDNDYEDINEQFHADLLLTAGFCTDAIQVLSDSFGGFEKIEEDQ